MFPQPVHTFIFSLIYFHFLVKFWVILIFQFCCSTISILFRWRYSLFWFSFSIHKFGVSFAFELHISALAINIILFSLDLRFQMIGLHRRYWRRVVAVIHILAFSCTLVFDLYQHAILSIWWYIILYINVFHLQFIYF